MSRHPLRASRLLPATLVSLALFAVACSGGSSNNNAATVAATGVAASATTPAARPATATRATTTRAGSPTPAPTCGNDPEYIAAVSKLNPLLLQSADLPGSLKGLQASTSTGIAICNAIYGQGLPNGAALTATLNQFGREGGVRLNWGANAQYTPGLKTVFSVVVDIAQFKTAAGAKSGLDLIFSAIGTGTPQPGSSAVKSSRLSGLSPAGDEIVGYRVEQTLTAAVGNSGTLQNVLQVEYVVAWRRGTALGTVTITAVNQDPSLSDINQIVAAQDAKLKAGGY